MHNGYLSLKTNFAIESKKIYKGTKALEKKSFLNNLELLFSPREKTIDNLKSRLFPIKNLDKIPTCQPTQATEPAIEPEVATEPTKATEITKAKNKRKIS